MDNFIECLFEVDEKSKVDDFREYAKSLADLLVNGSEELSKYYLGAPIRIPKSLFDKIFAKKDKSGDVYQYMEYLFAKLNEKGKIPILIFDVLENFVFQNLCRSAPKNLQMIKELTLNGNRLLLWSLFQFLVALTKVQHLCHVFCLSSDSLFIEYVYNTGELEGRAKYILIEDFDKETSLKFMDFLAKELLKSELSKEQKELIYSYVGGKPIDIIYTINEMKYRKLEDILNEMLNDSIQKLDMLLNKLDYITPKISIENEIIEIKKEDVVNALKLFKTKYEIDKKAISTPVYIYLIKENILFLNPQKGILKPQSYLVWNAIKEIV